MSYCKMWWLFLLPLVDATIIDFEWDATEASITLNTCLDSTLNITWAGNYNLVETEGAGCSSAEIVTISAGQNAGHIQTFNYMGNRPGMTRYFKDTNNCADIGGGSGKFQTYCPPAGTATTGPDTSFSCPFFPAGSFCATGTCVDLGCDPISISATTADELGGGNNEYCNDYAPLPEGYFPPVLQPSDPLYDADRSVECKNRCLSACESYETFTLLVFDGDTNQDLQYGGFDERRCMCGAGDCSVRSAGEAGNVYVSFTIDNPHDVNEHQCDCAATSNPSHDGSNGGIYCVNGVVNGTSDVSTTAHACSCLCDAGVSGVGCDILPAPEPGPATAPAANPDDSAPQDAPQEEKSTMWRSAPLVVIAFIVLMSVVVESNKAYKRSSMYRI